MLVIAVAFVLVTVAAVVLLSEASRSLVPPVGPGSEPITTHAATPAAARVPLQVPVQRTAADVNVAMPLAFEA